MCAPVRGEHIFSFNINIEPLKFIHFGSCNSTLIALCITLWGFRYTTLSTRGTVLIDLSVQVGVGDTNAPKVLLEGNVDVNEADREQNIAIHLSLSVSSRTQEPRYRPLKVYSVNC